MRSELFCLYLHQNYLDFFEKIEDVVRGREREGGLKCIWLYHKSSKTEAFKFICISFSQAVALEYLSDSDVLSSVWTDSQVSILHTPMLPYSRASRLIEGVWSRAVPRCVAVGYCTLTLRSVLASGDHYTSHSGTKCGERSVSIIIIIIQST